MPSTVFAAFKVTATNFPEHSLLCVPPRPDRNWLSDGIERTYAEVANAVATLSEKYATAGYGHGHRVALLLESRPEFFEHYLALNSLGVGIVPINPDYRHDEMLYQMSDSGAELAVVLPHRLKDLEQVARDRAAKGGKPLHVVDAYALPPSFPPPSSPPPRDGAPGLDTEAGLLYTSGTTGRPKGCILSNFYYLNSGQEYADLSGIVSIRRGQERFYNPLPLYHMNHQAITVTCAILTANCLVLPERFSPTRWWTEIATTRATIIHYLGIVAPTLLNQPETPEEKHHAVRFGVGAGMEPQLHATFEARFGFPMIEVWGMTETGRVLWNNIEPRHVDTRAFGRSSKTLEARVVDARDRDVEADGEGELIVRHTAKNPRRGFFSGYLNKPEATEEVWRGGWFRTGDVVRRDASGMLYFVDRMKNIIRRSGENIAAAEVEAALQSHAAVSQVAVIAAPDEVREEEVFACVVLMPGTEPTNQLAHDLFAWCNQRLAYYKPPGWILFLDKLPTTGTQKVQKTLIFPTCEDPRNRSGAIDLRVQKKRA